MAKVLAVLAFVAGFPAGAAMARDDCDAPMVDWRTREAVFQMAEDEGWTANRVRIRGGCYRIDGTDVDGRRIKVTVHPATLEVIELDYDDDDRTRRGDDSPGEDCDVEQDCSVVRDPAQAGPTILQQDEPVGIAAPAKVEKY